MKIQKMWMGKMSKMSKMSKMNKISKMNKLNKLQLIMKKNKQKCKKKITQRKLMKQNNKI